MKHIYKFIQYGIVFFAFFQSNFLCASTPVWTFTPLTATTTSVSPNGSQLIKYTVTNKSSKTHTLAMQPIRGINQITTAGNCPKSFTLASQQSCTLTLEIIGAALPGNLVGGPVVCQEGSMLECYQPSKANSLNISLLTTPQTTVTCTVAGQDNTTNLPLLYLTTDSGNSWRAVQTTSTQGLFNATSGTGG